MCNSIEWGRCEICGKETQLERTYFYYPIHCECCGNKENRHFEMIRHCKKCPAPMPKEIHPLCKAMDGKTYHASVSNMLPIDIHGEFIINERIIKAVIAEDRGGDSDAIVKYAVNCADALIKRLKEVNNE